MALIDNSVKFSTGEICANSNLTTLSKLLQSVLKNMFPLGLNGFSYDIMYGRNKKQFSFQGSLVSYISKE